MMVMVMIMMMLVQLGAPHFQDSAAAEMGRICLVILSGCNSAFLCSAGPSALWYMLCSFSQGLRGLQGVMSVVLFRGLLYLRASLGLIASLLLSQALSLLFPFPSPWRSWAALRLCLRSVCVCVSVCLSLYVCGVSWAVKNRSPGYGRVGWSFGPQLEAGCAVSSDGNCGSNMSVHDVGGRRRFEDSEFTLRIYPGVIAEGTIYCPVAARKNTSAAEVIEQVIDRLQLDRTKCYVLAEVKEFGGEEWILNPTDCPVQRMMLWPRMALENRFSSEDYRFLLREKNLDGSIHYGNLQMWLRVTEERRRMVERGLLPQPQQKDYDDLCNLPDLNEKTLLDNLRSRFKQEKIYTYVGSILIVINPFKFLPIYNPKYVKMYDNHQLGKLEPHIYAVADVAYHAMLQRRQNQCIVISGESGSGKTQSTNFLIHHLTALSQKGFASGVEQIILGAGPVLEGDAQGPERSGQIPSALSRSGGNPCVCLSVTELIRLASFLRAPAFLPGLGRSSLRRLRFLNFLPCLAWLSSSCLCWADSVTSTNPPTNPHHSRPLQNRGQDYSAMPIVYTQLTAERVKAFGNAKTAHNNNSSRFGKFIQVNYQESGTVRGAYVEKYLLEKSRLVYQEHNE
ncbi:hypothetical protein NFI96_006701, partial [Prochilodus magdalenae]